MGDLEYFTERVAHHRSPVAIWGVKRWFYARRAGCDSSVIDAVGILDVDVEERWEQLALASRCDHDKRVTYANFGWAIGMDLADSAEDSAQEIHGYYGVGDDHAGRNRVESHRRIDAHAAASGTQLEALRILIAKTSVSPFWIPAWG